jgi:hypothetical protein
MRKNHPSTKLAVMACWYVSCAQASRSDQFVSTRRACREEESLRGRSEPDKQDHKDKIIAWAAAQGRWLCGTSAAIVMWLAACKFLPSQERLELWLAD